MSAPSYSLCCAARNGSTESLPRYGFTVTAGGGLSDVEIHEAQDPILFLWRRLAPNSAGPGFYRGGTGMEQAYAMRYAELAPGCRMRIARSVPSFFSGRLASIRRRVAST